MRTWRRRAGGCVGWFSRDLKARSCRGEERGRSLPGRARSSPRTVAPWHPGTVMCPGIRRRLGLGRVVFRGGPRQMCMMNSPVRARENWLGRARGSRECPRGHDLAAVPREGFLLLRAARLRTRREVTASAELVARPRRTWLPTSRRCGGSLPERFARLRIGRVRRLRRSRGTSARLGGSGRHCA